MKKFLCVVAAVLITLVAGRVLGLNNPVSSTRIDEKNLKKPFARVEGTAGKEINETKTKIEAAPVSRGSLIIPPDNDTNITLKVYILEKRQVKTMNLEEYIEGVVAGEMPADFDIEALKAQAVAARTYTAARMKAFSGKGCSNHPGTDICTDSSHCQAWVPNMSRKIKDAVNATRGLILAYNSQPVMYPLFFSTSSGKTENSQDVFSGEYPYLKSVLSPYEEIAPKYLTKITFTKGQFLRKFNSYGVSLDKKTLPSQVKILSRTEGGSVKTIKVGAKNFSGVEIRKILNLNSANFSIEFGSDTVILTVTGYGHGVGMSQWGANEMGKRGSNYDEILRHYYQGTEIAYVKDVFK